jgi:hypothetical protein
MLDATVVDSIPFARTREAPISTPVNAERDRDGATGRFKLGNRAWEARCPAGPKPKFADAESLWKACVQYFVWVEDNPLYEMQLVTYQGRATHVPVRKMRAMSKGALYAFLSIQRTTWNAWKCDRPDLAEIIEKVEAVIWEQKFTGAAAGLFDAGIVARELGLASSVAGSFETSTRAHAREAES